MIEKIKPKYWTFVVLLLWGGLILSLGLIRFSAYSLDEGAAFALLINWSFTQNIANPMLIFGIPDFRALFFIPLGIYWPGSIVAAKIFSMLIAFAAAISLYIWSKNNNDDEAALLATGLFLIAPATLLQIDSLGIGLYFLCILGMGSLADIRYRQSPRSLTSQYFSQMLLISIAITLHPIGLAYPIALAWTWYREPTDAQKQKHIFIGIPITAAFMIAMQAGWVSLPWFSNPLVSLGLSLSSSMHALSEPNWILGAGMFILFVLICLFKWRNLTSGIIGMGLMSASIIGLVVADFSWALIVICLILYTGIPFLIELNNKFKLHSFFGKRGLVMVLLLLTSILFMNIDKAIALRIKNEVLSPHDQLIHALTNHLNNDIVETDKAKIRIASQWPARTMLASKFTTFTLPPSAPDGETLLSNIVGLTHFIFDHNDPNNSALAKNLAQISTSTETILLQDGGVIIKMRPPSASQN